MAFQGDSIYWVEVEKVVPNPFQPRREFDQNKLQELSESIRMYGVLQPLTVTRQEVQNTEDGTFYTQYELIAGERRLRASRLAGVAQVPVIIREGEDSEQEKLELAIIENLQREDLNAIDRALAFQQLADQFEMSQADVGKKVGRSREYVANSIRLLQLPKHMQEALQRGELGEGHARTLLMLTDRPEEQETIFREVLLKKMSVRELERIARKIATDKVRKQHKEDLDEHLIDIEKRFTETLGTRVQIQKTDFGGKLTIDYFSDEDLSALLERVKDEQEDRRVSTTAMAAVAAAAPMIDTVVSERSETPAQPVVSEPAVQPAPQPPTIPAPVVEEPAPAPLPTYTPTPAPTLTAAPTPEAIAMPPVTPVVHAQSTPPIPEPTPTPPTPTLQPVVEPTSLVQPTPVVQAPAPVITPAPIPKPPSSIPPAQPVNLVSGTPMQDMPQSPAAPVSVDPQVNNVPDDEDDSDIYSLRNFTV